MPVAKAKTLPVVEQRDGFHYRVVVVKWFAHAHEHDVGNALAFGGKLPGEKTRLIKNLCRVQLPRKSSLAR